METLRPTMQPGMVPPVLSGRTLTSNFLYHFSHIFRFLVGQGISLAKEPRKNRKENESLSKKDSSELELSLLSKVDSQGGIQPFNFTNFLGCAVSML